MEPSANILLRKLGILKAAKKQSAGIEAPKTQAKTTSLKSPVTLLVRVAAPTTARERAMEVCSEGLMGIDRKAYFW